MIRLAVEQDIPKVVDLVGHLVSAVGGPQRVCRIKTGETLAGLIRSDDGVVFVSECGFIAGMITQTVISPDPVAVELGWMSQDRSGIALLSQFEEWAAERGATLIKMSANGGTAQQILERAGYRACETAWVK